MIRAVIWSNMTIVPFPSGNSVLPYQDYLPEKPEKILKSRIMLATLRPMTAYVAQGLDALGGVVVIEPEHKSLSETLEEINTILDVADNESRQLNVLEGAMIIDATRSILLLLIEGE